MTSRIVEAGPAAETTRNVATGDIGFGFGPYAYAQNIQPPSRRPRGPQKLTRARTATATTAAAVTSPLAMTAEPSQYLSPTPAPPPPPPRRQATMRMASTNAVPAAALQGIALPIPKEGRASEETAVSIPSDPEWDAIPDDVWTLFSSRGWINMLTLVSILVAILVLFAGYPIINRYVHPPQDFSGLDVTYQDGLAPPKPTPTDDSR